MAGSVAFGPVLTALSTMQSSGDQSTKLDAHSFLEKFQKSVDAWATTHAMLQESTLPPDVKLFAATTLRGKIVYDLHQVPKSSHSGLRDTIINLIQIYKTGPKPIRTQLCVCLADLAIQMVDWKNILDLILEKLGNDMESGACVLEFLRVLPEEFTEGRKISLTEQELTTREAELLVDNATQVLALLVQYSQSSASAAANPLLLDCVTSWLREIGPVDLVKSPLLSTIFNGLSSETSFDSSVECLCAIFKETRDVDESLGIIHSLFPHVIALRPRIKQAADSEDSDNFKGITRLFAEAGESWVILIARMPEQFRPLVECILECAARDQDRDAIALTFNFWYELRLYIELEKYEVARKYLLDLYSQLVDIMLKHLEFPTAVSRNETDLFDGDREQEDKFREFRHSMGDVLKDCCEVLGPSECLQKAFVRIQQWVTTYGSLTTANNVPHWQELEAPLFSLRSMGRTVPPDEDEVLPKIIPILVQVPPHEKIRFAAIMAIGRYTEWTARHPEHLESQFQYVTSAFQDESKEVVRAAALALKFMCQDCRDLLSTHVLELQTFYDQALDSLTIASQEELTEGVAYVVSVQKPEDIYEMLKLYCNPLVNRLKIKATNAVDDKGKLDVADHLQLITIFIQYVQPWVDINQPNPAVKYCQDLLPVLAALVNSFLDFAPICERVCRCWRHMVLSYRASVEPLLPSLANTLAQAFAASKQGCFLWTSSAIVREFSEDAESVSSQTTDAIYQFFETQVTSMLRALSDVPPGDLPDVIEDFFRLLVDGLLYYPFKLISSQLFPPIFEAALSSLTLQQNEPLTATLYYIRDVLSYGSDNPPSEAFAHVNSPDPSAVRKSIRDLMTQYGEKLVHGVMTGMMFTFPRDCFPDASGVLLGLFQVMPQQTAVWIGKTLKILPEGTITAEESERLMVNIQQKIQDNQTQKVRYLLQDFTNSYRRRNVAPRDGLGRLEATKFRFSG